MQDSSVVGFGFAAAERAGAEERTAAEMTNAATVP
jgi:hypothetical protein